MKLNKKGFMLAEVVVVAVVIATVLVTLYTALNRVSSAYETRNRYYDIDSLYAAIEINEILKELSSTNIYEIDTPQEVSAIDSEIETFNNFYYNETNSSITAYFTPYDKDNMLYLKNLNSNLTFNDYLDYLSDNLDFEDEYNYMIIVERRNNDNIDDCYYYALKVRHV